MRNYIIILCCLFACCRGRTEGPDVVDGTDVSLQEIPYQVSLQLAGFHFCGGTIISEYYVLTAAHCSEEYNKTTFSFVYAAAGMIDVYAPGQIRHISKFMNHEKYDANDSYRNDIALVKLKAPFTFNSKVKPVTLPTADLSVPAGSSVVLSGWGSLGGKENKLPRILKKVTLFVVDQDECRSAVKKNNGKDHLYQTNICAYDPETRKGQCGGDSGGPLIFKGIQVGLVSWSVKDPVCASVRVPGLYTRISEYIDWIKKHAV